MSVVNKLQKKMYILKPMTITGLLGLFWEAQRTKQSKQCCLQPVLIVGLPCNERKTQKHFHPVSQYIDWKHCHFTLSQIVHRNESINTRCSESSYRQTKVRTSPVPRIHAPMFYGPQHNEKVPQNRSPFCLPHHPESLEMNLDISGRETHLGLNG